MSADTFGHTAMKIAEATVYSDGRVVWGYCDEGFDRCGIKVMRSVMKHIDIRNAEWRIGAHFDKACPIWWQDKHKRALEMAMSDMKGRIIQAGYASTRGNRIDCGDTVPKNIQDHRKIEVV